MTKSSKGNCGWCGTKRCMRCGKCPNIDCEASVSCDRPSGTQVVDPAILRTVHDDDGSPCGDVMFASGKPRCITHRRVVRQETVNPVTQHEPIIPEPIHLDNPRYAPGHWDYPRRCADVELALACARERVEEWDQATDPHGWWHERPDWIALYNEVLRLREELARRS